MVALTPLSEDLESSFSDLRRIESERLAAERQRLEELRGRVLLERREQEKRAPEIEFVI